MAPSPENDDTPKAPDKIDKTKAEIGSNSETSKDNDKDEKTLKNLNDGELKALLDEAITYKNPKDREGKSKLFKDLLNQAEETERIARATSAGGSEVARHYNTSAARRHHGRHGGGGASGHHGGGRHHGRHRKPSSISENMMHGGSLDNLAKEELFLESAHYLVNKMKTVSARQREGGSLPCDVNASVISPHDLQFIEEAKKNKQLKSKEYTAIDIETSSEKQRLLDHDSLAENYQESQEITIAPRYTTQATLQISATPVDEPIALDLDSGAEKTPFDPGLPTKILPSRYNLFALNPEYKKDENGNALQQNAGGKTKKKKTQTDKNVVVRNAESVEGHRGDIINDVEKLTLYVMGTNDDTTANKPTKSNVHKSKQLHKQHASEDSGRGSGGNLVKKQQRAHSSKGKESRSEMKKSNSLGEIPTAMDDFAFVGGAEQNEADQKIVLRTNKGQADKPKERRSWGHVDPPSFQAFSTNASTENLETADNWVVTKTKKKSKKRRNSVSSSSRRQASTAEAQAAKKHSNRVPSPDLRGKISSGQHSEKSDMSDADSEQSMPNDNNQAPISYADIAKNNEKNKEKKSPSEKSTSSEKSEKADRVPNKERSPKYETDYAKREKFQSPQAIVKSIANLNHVKVPQEAHVRSVADTSIPVLPPNVNDTKSFPAMPADSSSAEAPCPSLPAPPPPESDTRQFPPDVTDTKSFPAMPSDGSARGFHSLPSEGSSGRSYPAIPGYNVGGGHRGVPVEKRSSSNVGQMRNVSPKYAPSSAAGARGPVNVQGGGQPSTVCSDIKSDLKLIHSNATESIQQNALKLPPNTPYVQTIEQMQIMQCTPPHQAEQQYSSPPIGVAASQTMTGYAAAGGDAPSLPIKPKSTDCDMNRTSDVREGASEGDRPPVVILSGAGNKEVTGLTFGFDVNEQLLHEDVCENFMARYVDPDNYLPTAQEHGSIVDFISSSWDAVFNQSDGIVQYYTEDS